MMYTFTVYRGGAIVDRRHRECDTEVCARAFAAYFAARAGGTVMYCQGW